MNCSGKFFEPTVTVLLALAGFFWISFPPPLLVVLPPPPLEPLSELLLLSLPHAARTPVSARTTRPARTAVSEGPTWAARPARIDFLIRPAPLLVFEWQRTFRAVAARPPAT